MIQFGSRGEVLGKFNRTKLKGLGASASILPEEEEEEVRIRELWARFMDSTQRAENLLNDNNVHPTLIDQIFNSLRRTQRLRDGLSYMLGWADVFPPSEREEIIRTVSIQLNQLEGLINRNELLLEEVADRELRERREAERDEERLNLMNVNMMDDAEDDSNSPRPPMNGQGIFVRDLGKYPPEMRKNLEKYGNDPIEKIQVFRYPLKEVSALVKLITGGKATYDQLFHLGLQITTSKGKFTLDKSTVWDFKKSQLKSQKGLSFISVDKFDYPITINEMLEKAVKRVGVNQHFKYRALSWNCQDAVNNMLNVINGNNKKIKNFVLQDMDKVAETLPGFSQAILNVGNKLGEMWNRFVKGEGSFS